LWASLSSLVTFIILVWGSGAGCSFSSFSTKLSIELVFFFFLSSTVSLPSSSLHCSNWFCATMFLIG
jgi:hypothetical protein